MKTTLGVATALLFTGLVCVYAEGDEKPDAPPPVNAGTPSDVDLRAPAVREGFSVLIYGDRTGGKPQGLKILERVVEVSNTLDPDFVMTVGDMINGYNEPAQWKRQAAEYLDTVGKLKMPWYPVAGNHDVYGGRQRPEGHLDLYQQTFGPLYYSFDYRFAHFIALFSDESLGFRNPAVTQNMSEKQMQWLRDDLKATKAEQIYVFLHHPRWLYKGCELAAGARDPGQGRQELARCSRATSTRCAMTASRTACTTSRSAQPAPTRIRSPNPTASTT